MICVWIMECQFTFGHGMPVAPKATDLIIDQIYISPNNFNTFLGEGVQNIASF